MKNFISLLVVFILLQGPTAFAQCLSGTYTVGGLSPSFPSITAAINALQTYGVCGPTVFDVRPGNYGSIYFPAILGSSSVNTIVFKSEFGDSVNTIIYRSNSNSSTNNYALRFDGGEYITFQGFTINNVSSGYTHCIEYYGLCKHISISNCRITAPIASSTSFNLDLVYDNDRGDDSLVFRNNIFIGGAIAIDLSIMQQPRFRNLVIDKNIFQQQKIYAISLQYLHGVTISQNHITSTQAGYGGGIGVNIADSTFVISGNQIYLSSGQGIGVNHSGSPTFQGIISNNMILAGGSGAFHSIYVAGSYNHVIHNSLRNSGASPSSALYLDSYTNGTVLNNILYASASTSRGLTLNNSTPTQINYNNIYSAGSTMVMDQATPYSNLLAWSGASGFDINSVSSIPGFISNFSNFHLVNDYVNNNAGANNSWVNSDIDGEVRNVNAPDIGADEYWMYANEVALLAVDTLNQICYQNVPINVNIRNTGTSTLNTLDFYYSVHGNTPLVFNWVGSLAPGQALNNITIATVNFPFSNSFIKVWTSMPNGVLDSLNTNDTLIRTTAFLKMGGDYFIGGTNPDYGTLTSAVQDLSTRGICSLTRLLIRPGIYYEQVAVNSIAGTNAVDSVIIMSENGDSSQVIFSYGGQTNTFDDFLFKLDNVRFVRLSRITAKSTSQNYATIVVMKNSTSRVKVENCIFLGNPSTVISSNSFGVFHIDYSIDSIDLVHSALLNNKFGFWAPTYTSWGQSAINIIGNQFLNQGQGGIIFLGGLKGVIKSNVISSYAFNGFQSFTGIECGHSKFNLVSSNRIRYVHNVSGSSSIFRGIWDLNYPGYIQYLAGYDTIVNNEIIIIDSTTYSVFDNPPDLYGIDIEGSRNLSLLNNSVLISNTPNSNRYAYGLHSDYGSTANDSIVILNNIIQMDANDPNSRCVYLRTFTPNLAMNNNDYYYLGLWLGDYTGFYGIGSANTLSNWQVLTTKDLNALDLNPGYFSTSYLNINNPTVGTSAQTHPSVPVDIDGVVRSSTPSIGAYENPGPNYFPTTPIEKPMDDLVLYPQPAIDILNGDLRREILVPHLLSLKTIEGRSIRKLMIYSSEFQLSVSDIPSGIYQIEVKGPEFRVIRPISIVR